ncbi:MAG: TIGR02302 family protein [Pseudomonadota bacterium]
MPDSTNPTTKPTVITGKLRRSVTWTRLGLVAERFVRAFWPLWAVLLAALAMLMLGVHEVAAIELVWAGMVITPLAAVAALVHGIRKFRFPTAGDAKRRLDETLPGRPIAALEDSQAIGATDPASRAVWEAHQKRMADRVAGARAVKPDLNLAPRDPYGLRYVALMVFAVGLLFGSIWRVDSIADMTPGQADALALGPSWEGWVEPPRYTGRPSLYLADIPEGTLEIPKGSRVLARLYGEVGALTLTETVSGRLEDTGSVSDPVQEFDIAQAGEIAINGANGRVWQVLMAPDDAPTVEIDGQLTSAAAGDMTLPFKAQDDFGVVGGQAVVTLHLPEVTRAYGLTIDPEPREPLLITLPMPISGDRSDFTEMLNENLSEHPWANLPILIHLEVQDALDQVGRTEELMATLPGRRFFVPLARAIIEQRQALLWNLDNGEDAAAVLRAISHLPEGLFRSEVDYLRLRHTVRQLESAMRYGPGLSAERRDEIAKDLWDLALRIEEGTLSNAMDRLRRAQERLEEAMRNGASQDEIAELMRELREAMQDYMRQLAEQAQQNGEQQAQNQENSQTITGDQLQDMLDQLQQLMEEGRMAEAMQMLEQLRQMMENMQMAQGQQGGQPSQGQQALQGLQETLRNQQGLSDDSFRELQDQFNQQQGQQPGQQQGQQQGQGQGQQPGQQPGQGQQGEGQGQAQGQGQGQGHQQGQGGMGLAERQQALRDTLRQQQQNLPGGGGANDALDRAGRAMEGAEQALRDGDMRGALDNQADAMDAIREGMQDLAEEMAQQQAAGEGRQGGTEGQAAEAGGNDPLGRRNGTETADNSARGMLPGETPAGRAQELQDEIRRRSTEQSRPEAERDYLNRLLDRFSQAR